MRAILMVTGAVWSAACLTTELVAQTIAITGARVYPVSGPPINNGTVLVRAGKIVAVGAEVTVPADAQRIDANGKWITPGIFNAATTLGVNEVGQVQETQDASARGKGDGITASFRVWDGINPASPLWQVARNDGITTVGVVADGGLIAGQTAVVDLSEGSLGDLVLRAPATMMADIASKGPTTGQSRGEVLGRLREVLDDTRAYMRRRAEFEGGNTREFAARRADLEAMIPVVQGTLPLVITADRASDIEQALDVAKDYRLKLILQGAAEGWKVADKIAAANVPVMVGSLNNLPFSFAALGARQDNASLLHAAGARVIINGGADAFNARNVKYEAGVAVAYGLPWDAALRAVTLTPAEALGVADRVGTLATGKDATLVVWSGDPFEPLTKAERVYIRGVEMQKPSRQDELMRRYKTLPPEYRRVP
jgi:imidazolonepropionase-like amidohydrolase